MSCRESKQENNPIKNTKINKFNDKQVATAISNAMQANDTNEFVEVKYKKAKKHPIVGTKINGSNALKAAPTTCAIHVSKLRPETIVNDIKGNIQDNFPQLNEF